MSFRVEITPPRRNLRADIEAESQRIVAAGGQPIPREVIEECGDLQYCHMNSPVDLKKEILRRIEPYRLTEPKRWAEHCTKLKAALLKSSRFTRLRMSRGLPFKSHRQPV
jgi:hypothetical protein